MSKLQQKVEMELRKPISTYEHVALTDNYIVATDDMGSPNGENTCIKYTDIVWIYLGESGGFGNANIARVLSLATGNSKYAKAEARAGVLGDFASGLIGSFMGIPHSQFRTTAIIFSKDNQAVCITDTKARLQGGIKKAFTNKIKGSKKFIETLDIILNKCPENVMLGEEYEDDYCNMMGINLYTSPDNDVSDDDDEDDSF